MSEAPRVDALLLEINEGRTYDYNGPIASFARHLERENNQLKARVAELEGEAERIRHEVIRAAYRPGPMCRDCADNEGRCPRSGELCDPYQAALERLRKTEALSPAPVGEAVAQVDEDDSGLFIEILYGDEGTPLKCGDKLYLHAASPPPAADVDCICRGNWRLLVEEYRDRIGQRFRDKKGDVYTFFGLVLSDDDYYYGMSCEGKGVQLLSCVGDIDAFGLEAMIEAGR